MTKIFSILFFIFSLLGCSANKSNPSKRMTSHKNNIDNITSSDKNIKTEYFTGGKIRSQFIPDKNQENSGILYRYNYDEQIMSATHISNGHKEGIETFYDTEGHIVKQTPYINGIKNGIVKIYYPDTKLLAEITYVNNQRNGKAAKYNHDGSLNEEVYYKHGKLVNRQSLKNIISQ